MYVNVILLIGCMTTFLVDRVHGSVILNIGCMAVLLYRPGLWQCYFVHRVHGNVTLQTGCMIMFFVDRGYGSLT